MFVSRSGLEGTSLPYYLIKPHISGLNILPDWYQIFSKGNLCYLIKGAASRPLALLFPPVDATRVSNYRSYKTTEPIKFSPLIYGQWFSVEIPAVVENLRKKEAQVYQYNHYVRLKLNVH